MVDYVQIGQKEPGRAALYVMVKNGDDFADLFVVLSNVGLDFEFKAIDRPIRTKAGSQG